MEKKINIAKLLKNCPKGMQLDCKICNGVKFARLEPSHNFPIVMRANNGYEFTLTKYGQVHNIDDAKCVIFPQGKTTWEGFQIPFQNGDIVAYVDDDEGCIQVFIFKEYIEDESDYACCYVMLDDDGGLVVGVSEYYVTRFATEEEKQKLFQAIKDNGYEWNAETKTLKKVIEGKLLWNIQLETELKLIVS